MYFVTEIHISYTFDQDDPVLPTPPPIFFSSDFGNSRDPAGLGLGGGQVPRMPPPVATLLHFTYVLMDAWYSITV